MKTIYKSYAFNRAIEQLRPLYENEPKLKKDVLPVISELLAITEELQRDCGNPWAFDLKSIEDLKKYAQMDYKHLTKNEWFQRIQREIRRIVFSIGDIRRMADNSEVEIIY